MLGEIHAILWLNPVCLFVIVEVLLLVLLLVMEATAVQGATSIVPSVIGLILDQKQRKYNLLLKYYSFTTIT